MTVQTTTREATRPPIMVRQGIEAVKDEVSIERYLEAQGVEVSRNRARCIVHDGDNPTSFELRPGDKWRCHACGEFGDVIDLATLVERHADTWTAVVSLAMGFGVELPRRPEKWRNWTVDKEQRRDKALEALTKTYQRRY